MYGHDGVFLRFSVVIWSQILTRQHGERQPVAKEEQKPSSRDVLRARARDMEECRKVRSSGGLLGDSCIVVFVQNLVLHYAREAEHALMH